MDLAWFLFGLVSMFGPVSWLFLRWSYEGQLVENGKRTITVNSAVMVAIWTALMLFLALSWWTGTKERLERTCEELSERDKGLGDDVQDEDWFGECYPDDAV